MAAKARSSDIPNFDTYPDTPPERQKQGAGRGELSAIAEQWKQNAQRRVHDAQQRARRIVRENPLAVIAVVAGVAFLLGAALRIWRSERD